MTRWEQFVELLRKKKSDKTLGKLNVASLITMIYSGAFDEAMGARPSFVNYVTMMQQLLAATGSKAGPAKAKKTDLIGLDKVIQLKDPSLLGVWRWQVNPLAKTDLLPLLKPLLEHNKFTNYQSFNKRFIMERNENRFVTYVTTIWSDLFEDEPTRRLVVKDKSVRVALPGIVTGRSERPFGNEGKRMAVISFYTGEDYAPDLVMWPDYGELDFNRARYEAMAPLTRGILIVKPTEWNGRRGGRIEAFIRDVSQMRKPEPTTTPEQKIDEQQQPTEGKETQKG